MSGGDAVVWADWASKAAFAMLAQSFEGVAMTPVGEPRPPAGAMGLAVAWWVGDKLRAIAWEEDQSMEGAH